MSEDNSQQYSFLWLVPLWQRPLVEIHENEPYRARRSSTASSLASISSTSSSSDYGENGFLVLTAATSFDLVEGEQ
jgi:hypothetical protein